MTREEAVNVLKNTTLILGKVNGKMALAEAVNMAITALQTDGDCISRQAAIDEVAEWMLEYGGEDEKRERVALGHVANGIKKLPSVQPERFKSCKNCIHLGHGYMMPCKNCRRNQVMPDWYEVET